MTDHERVGVAASFIDASSFVAQPIAERLRLFVHAPASGFEIIGRRLVSSRRERVIRSLAHRGALARAATSARRPMSDTVMPTVPSATVQPN